MAVNQSPTPIVKQQANERWYKMLPQLTAKDDYHMRYPFHMTLAKVLAWAKARPGQA